MRKFFSTKFLLIFILLTGTNLQSQQFKFAFVVNNLAESLTKIDLLNNIVYSDEITLGLVPNKITLRGNSAYVVNSISANIYVIDLEKFEIAETIDVGEGENPWDIAILNDDSAYVSNFQTSSVSLVSLSENKVLKKIDVGLSPEGLLIHGNKLFVCNTGFNPETFEFDAGTVSIIDVGTNMITSSLPAGINPQYMAVDGQGLIHIVSTGNYADKEGVIYILDPDEEVVLDSIPIGGFPGSIAIAGDSMGYLGAGGWGDEGFVFSYNTITRTVLRGPYNPIIIGPGVTGISVDKDNNVYACNFNKDTITKISPDLSVEQIYKVNQGPIDLAIWEGGEPSEAFSEKIYTLKGYKLNQNYPNPFNDETLISFYLPEESKISLKIYNLSGKLVKTIVPGDFKSPGNYTVTWNGTSDAGVKVSSGIYFVQLAAPELTLQRKIAVLK
ncbi:MAG: FlgD immunoglobulin-like domain containing protein [Fidelibacterota bacterium]